MEALRINFRILVFVILVFVSVNSARNKPHIIYILADDMGWNDVSFHGGNQIPTPNIDALAYNGIVLNSHYSQALCTPSRSALLTGKYPIHLGMQHLVLLEPEPRGLPLEEKLMPEYLQEAGYSTHIVGKWHLGFYKHEYTPTYRGFDTHYGYFNGVQDYYSHETYATFGNMSGYDMRRNMAVDYDSRGKYSTTLFTDEAVRLIREHNAKQPMFLFVTHLAPHSGNRDAPLQAPDEEIAKFAHIPDPERRIYAAMVSLLDKSVGEIMSALRQNGMLENSIVVFVSDNGAQTFGIHGNHGSNSPLKGMKASPWEGGTRTNAAVWSPLLKNTQYASDHLMHISDWMPTLFSAAGISIKQLGNIDGIDMWDALSRNTKSQRLEMVYNVDDTYNYAAVRRGDWKYVFGTISNGNVDGWYGDTGLGPQYTYNEDSVMQSKTNIALTGVITQQQIQEKHERGLKDTSNFNFTYNLLTKEKLRALRNQSTITCTKQVDETSNHKCNPLESPCLFNIREDPCEMVNLANERPVILKNLENALEQIRKTIIPETNLPDDPNADPAKWNNTWVPWQDFVAVKSKLVDEGLNPTSFVVLGVLCALFFVIVMILIALSVKSSNMKKHQASNSELFARHDHDEALEVPSGVIHIISDDKGESFQNNELSRHSSIKNDTRNIH